jgi:hypothetical protein
LATQCRQILRYHITSTVVITLPNTSEICSFSVMSGNICGLDDSLCIYIISPSCSHYYLSNHYGTSQMSIDIFSFVKIMSSFLCLYHVRRVHSHIRGIDFTSFLDIDLGVCGCPDNVVFSWKCQCSSVTFRNGYSSNNGYTMVKWYKCTESHPVHKYLSRDNKL